MPEITTSRSSKPKYVKKNSLPPTEEETENVIESKIKKSDDDNSSKAASLPELGIGSPGNLNSEKQRTYTSTSSGQVLFTEEPDRSHKMSLLEKMYDVKKNQVLKIKHQNEDIEQIL